MKNHVKKGTKGFIKIHGKTGTSLFSRWQSMLFRVKKGTQFDKWYYEKGITVCKEWYAFDGFESWAVINGFSKELELDRIDNSKGYSPDNCRWTTKKINHHNRDNTVIVDYNGKKQPLTFLCEELNLTQLEIETIRHRICRGWDYLRAIETPILKGNFGHKGTYKVVDKSTGKIYNSMKEASVDFGISTATLSRRLRGIIKNTTTLEYLEEQWMAKTWQLHQLKKKTI